MKTKKPANRLFAFIVILSFLTSTSFAQGKSFENFSNANADDVVMTWDKNTPEQEMKDDIKALAEKGITIKYQDVKRNSKNEITAIKVSFEDRKGNKGNLSYANQNPISKIVFHKNGDQIGFGEAQNNGNFGMNFGGMEDLMKQFKLQGNEGNSQSFSFQFPNGGEKPQTSIRKKIQINGKKPVVIENGKIIEGGEEYTQDELDGFLKEDSDSTSIFGQSFDQNKAFDFRNEKDLNDFKDQFGKMQSEFKNRSESENKEMLNATEELKKAKVEMQKAKDELEKTRKQLLEKYPSKKI